MKRWSRKDVIALVGILVAATACVGRFVVPEVRELLGVGTPTPADTRTAIPRPLETTLPPAYAPAPGYTWARPIDVMMMVYVPAGAFRMGSTDTEIDAVVTQCEEMHGGDCARDWQQEESPAHSVALDSYWIDQAEVTNAQYAAFLNKQGNQVEGGVAWLELSDDDCLIELMGAQYRPRVGYADHPVTQVSWYGASAYCAWVGGRLPTEAEWEYAARGEHRYIYPWGDVFDGARANFCDINCRYSHRQIEYDDGWEETAPVGQFVAGASWCGALDMAGNVWEWIADWYGEYPAEQQINPTGPSTGAYRVVRGGSYRSDPTHLRASDRPNGQPGDRSSFVGFRCAMPLGD
jgi:formylglycine-generating enzyme required for sulfatase activity